MSPPAPLPSADAVPLPPPANPVAPAPQGTTSQAPRGCLRRIAAAAGTTTSELATLLVTSSTPSMYHALIEYAALTAPEPTTPADAPPPLGGRLQVAAEDPFQPKNEDDNDDDDEISSTGFGRELRRLTFGRPSAVLRAGKGSAKRKVPVPKFKFALGETELIWPPPPELSSKRIASLGEKESRARKKRKMDANAVDGAADGGADGMADSVADGVADGEADGMEHTSANAPVEDGKDVKRFVIHMVHYAIGEPKLSQMGRFMSHREILLATTESAETLCKFTQEVMQWRVDKDFRDGHGTKFCLHRFKTESCSGWWEDEGMKRARPASSVVLGEGQLEAIMEDVSKFLEPQSRKWYAKHGLPHRRSYLFYGPPGTGKTSTIRAIASAFGFNCCFLSMTNSNFSNQLLGDALSKIPPNALLVLEDVDALFNEDRKSENTNNLTFSGLLNALDGVISSDGVITAMTTNHIDRLDKALLRGGRVDRRFRFGMPTQEQLQKLFETFYPNSQKELQKKFAEVVFARPEGQEARSIATLQQLFIQQRESSAEACLAAVGGFFDTHFPNGIIGKNDTLYT